MKKFILFLYLFIILFCLSSWAQIAYQTIPITITTTGRYSITNIQGDGAQYHQLVINTLGTVTTCGVTVDSSSNGSSWSSGGIISSQNCGGNTNITVVSSSVISNYVSINVGTLTGGGSLILLLTGFMNAPLGAGISSTLGNPVIGLGSSGIAQTTAAWVDASVISAADPCQKINTIFTANSGAFVDAYAYNGTTVNCLATNGGNPLANCSNGELRFAGTFVTDYQWSNAGNGVGQGCYVHGIGPAGSVLKASTTFNNNANLRKWVVSAGGVVRSATASTGLVTITISTSTTCLGPNGNAVNASSPPYSNGNGCLPDQNEPISVACQNAADSITYVTVNSATLAIPNLTGVWRVPSQSSGNGTTATTTFQQRQVANTATNNGQGALLTYGYTSTGTCTVRAFTPLYIIGNWAATAAALGSPGSRTSDFTISCSPASGISGCIPMANWAAEEQSYTWDLTLQGYNSGPGLWTSCRPLSFGGCGSGQANSGPYEKLNILPPNSITANGDPDSAAIILPVSYVYHSDHGNHGFGASTYNIRGFTQTGSSSLGTVNVSGTTVTYVSGAQFSTQWTSSTGSSGNLGNIVFNGSNTQCTGGTACSISSCSSATSCTLTTSISSTLTGVTYSVFTPAAIGVEINNTTPILFWDLHEEACLWCNVLGLGTGTEGVSISQIKGGPDTIPGSCEVIIWNGYTGSSGTLHNGFDYIWAQNTQENICDLLNQPQEIPTSYVVTYKFGAGSSSVITTDATVPEEFPSTIQSQNTQSLSGTNTTNASTTATVNFISGWSGWPVYPNQKLSFLCTGLWQNNTISDGIGLGVLTPASPTAFSVAVQIYSTNTGTNTSGQLTAPIATGTACASQATACFSSAGANAANTSYQFTISGTITNGSSFGNITPQFLAVTGGTASLRNGMLCYQTP